MVDRVIIPAAGVGSRLSRQEQHRPKCLMEVQGRSIADRTIALCKERGIHDFVYIVGYEAEAIQAELAGKVRFHHNPFYRVSNSIASLWLARQELVGDVIIMNSDVFFEPEILDTLLADDRPAVLLCDRSRIEGADYRFKLDGDRIVKYGKELTVAETDAEYVGIARISAAFIKPFADRLDHLVKQGRLNAWWEDALYDLAAEGMPIYARDIAGRFWGEVDFMEDYQRLVAWRGK
jgi:L-glutamine-phosphate cytidylyltransferase